MEYFKEVQELRFLPNCTFGQKEKQMLGAERDFIVCCKLYLILATMDP